MIRSLTIKKIIILLLSLGFIGVASAGEVDTNISKLKASNACVSCNLNRAYLSKADLSGAILSYTDFRETTLAAANLSGANFSGANLTNANLYEVKLCRTIMPNGFSDNSWC